MATHRRASSGAAGSPEVRSPGRRSACRTRPIVKRRQISVSLRDRQSQGARVRRLDELDDPTTPASILSHTPGVRSIRRLMAPAFRFGFRRAGGVAPLSPWPSAALSRATALSMAAIRPSYVEDKAQKLVRVRCEKNGELVEEVGRRGRHRASAKVGRRRAPSAPLAFVVSSPCPRIAGSLGYWSSSPAPVKSPDSLLAFCFSARTRSSCVLSSTSRTASSHRRSSCLARISLTRSSGCGANILRSSQAGAGKLRWITQREPRSKSWEPCCLDAQSTEFELTLADPVHEFDAGDRRCGLAEMLEAEHRTEPKLDGSVILFDQIVQIF